MVSAADPASARMVAQIEGGGWAVYDWSPDGKKITGDEMFGSESYLWLVDVASGDKDVADSQAPAQRKSPTVTPYSARMGRAFT